MSLMLTTFSASPNFREVKLTFDALVKGYYGKWTCKCYSEQRHIGRKAKGEVQYFRKIGVW